MTQGNGSGAAQPRTTLRFFGQAQGVKVNVPKGGYNDDSGSIDITFRVTAPKRPSDPRRYRNTWEIDKARTVVAEYGGVRPDPKEDKKAATAFDNAQKTIETVTNRHRVDDERYARELATHGPALMAYAQLVGLVAMFGDQRLEITLAPADQDLLPGMGITLALPDGQAAPNYRAQRERMVALGRHPTGFALAGADHPGQGHTCGDCAHHYVRQFAGRYHKCDLIRATGGPASDIRVRWTACENWEAEAQDG